MPSRLFIASLAVILAILEPRAVAAPLRVLILSGENNHDWRATTPVLKATLEAGGLCEVTVTENPASLQPADLDALDVVLSNYNTFPRKDAPSAWNGGMRAAFIEWIRRGRGFVAVHAGSSVFYDWQEFQALAGTSWGPSSRHGKIHSEKVSILAVEHPVTAGLAGFETRDEFWEGSSLSAGSIVLATVTPNPEFGGNGRPQPVALATSLGAGRGFTLLLGHDAAAMKNEGFARLLRRGTEWAAKGSVVSSLSPTPAP